MSEIPPPGTPGQGPVNPTPPPGGPSPFNLGYATPGTPFDPPPSQDDKTMGMLAHLLGIFTCWVGPLVIWLIKREKSPFVNDQGKEALNWQLTVFIVYVVFNVTIRFLPHLVGCIFCFVPFAAWVLNVIFVIQGSMAASKGIAYRYPYSLKLIK